MGKRTNKHELKLVAEVTECLKTLDRAQTIVLADARMYREYVKILNKQHKDLTTLKKEFVEGKKSIADTIGYIHWIGLKYNTLLTHESKHRDGVVEKINELLK
jgi:hypothetical protein